MHDQIQKISNKIELDLANLRCDQAYVTHEKILKSNRRYMKVVSGVKKGWIKDTNKNSIFWKSIVMRDPN